MPGKCIKVPYIPYKPKTNLPYYLDSRYCRPAQISVPWPSKNNILTLDGLSREEVNKMAKPNCWNWSIDDVGDWVEHTLGFPQYRNCFANNYINGRKLILVDASTLPRWNITDFDHIKAITAAIRNILNIVPEYFSRSLTLPPREPETMFLIYKRPTGILQDRKTRTKILQEVGYLISRPTLPFNLWDSTKFEKPKFPKEKVGLWRVRTNRQLSGCKLSPNENAI